MSGLSINNLPAEILTEVFGYLNGRNLKNATIVCQLWKNLIESAFRWSLKLQYDTLGEFRSNIPDDAEQPMNFILNTNRKFGTLEIYGARFKEDNQIVEIFKRHGFNVVELHFRECSIDNLTGFAGLLKCTPNLKHVVVSIKRSHGSSDVLLMDQLLPDLKKLKSLVIRGSDFRVIKCFRKAKLTTMEIGGYMSSEPRSLLVDFLSTQDKLTSLTAVSYSSPILVEMGKLNVPIPFRLKQLSISDIDCQEPSQDHDYLIRFLDSQAGNLTAIEMKDEIRRSVYECVFANMTKLNTLSLRMWDLPRDNDFCGRLKENCNVYTLKLQVFPMFDNQNVGRFLQKLPNVRCLILRNAKRSLTPYILVMAQSLGRLESLHIGLLNSLDGVKFPNLKTMHIQHLLGEINWNQFTKDHPLLTELTIETMEKESYLTSDDIEQMTNNVDLQHIRLGAGFVADTRFFEIVGSKCKNLKVLDLDKSCVSQNIGHYMKIDVLRLRDGIQYPEVFYSRFLS